MLQVLWKLLFVHRFAGHPLNSFIDLLFLANTSAIVMDERHSGYYLHGRNQMHHSGTARVARLGCKCTHWYTSLRHSTLTPQVWHIQ